MTPSLLSNELVAVAASGGARWEQICRARWCWEPTGRVWWLFILTRRGPVWQESTLYQGARAFPGACATVLLHPEEVQSRKVKQSSGSGEDSAKPYSLSELNPQCGCTPPPPKCCWKKKPPCQRHKPCARRWHCHREALPRTLFGTSNLAILLPC